MFPRAAETAGVAFGFCEGIRGFPGDLFVAGDDHLGDAFAGFYGLWLVGEVDDDALDFAAVVAVDRSGRVEHGEAAIDGQAAAGADLRLVAVGQFDEQARRDEGPTERGQGDRGVELGP